MLRTPYVTQVIAAVFGEREDPDGISTTVADPAPTLADQLWSAAVTRTLGR